MTLTAALALLVGFWGTLSAVLHAVRGVAAPVVTTALHAVLTHPLAVVLLYTAAGTLAHHYGDTSTALLAVTAAFTTAWFGWDFDKTQTKG